MVTDQTSTKPHLRRNEFYVVLTAMTVTANLASHIKLDINQYGLIESAGNTFGISLIVWVSLYFCFKFLLDDEMQSAPDRLDWLLIVPAAIAVLGGGEYVGWIILSIVAAQIIYASDRGSALRKGGFLLLAVTFPMFWSKRIFSLFSEYILAIDASLVSSVTQTPRIGNMVAIPGNGGYLEIAAMCSSMANVSLTFLCWALFSQLSTRAFRHSDLYVLMFACVAVVAINVFRISLIGFFPHHYDLIHGPVGATISSYLISIVVILIFYKTMLQTPNGVRA